MWVHAGTALLRQAALNKLLVNLQCMCIIQNECFLFVFLLKLDRQYCAVILGINLSQFTINNNCFKSLFINFTVKMQ